MRRFNRAIEKKIKKPEFNIQHSNFVVIKSAYDMPMRLYEIKQSIVILIKYLPVQNSFGIV